MFMEKASNSKLQKDFLIFFYSQYITIIFKDANALKHPYYY